MPLIKWDETSPSGDSAVGRGPQDIQGQLKAIDQGFNESLEFPAGNMAQGGSRAYVGPTSESSFVAGSQNTNRGKLFYDSNRTEVYYYVPLQTQTGSGPATFNVSLDSYLFGSPRYIEHATNPLRGQWVETSGTSSFVSFIDHSNMTFSFTSDGIKHGDESANIEFDTPPNVYVHSESLTAIFHVSTVTRGGFAVWVWAHDKATVANSVISLHWISSGTLTKSYQ